MADVIGIDPSLNGTAFAHCAPDGDVRIVKPRPPDHDDTTELQYGRLRQLSAQIVDLIGGPAVLDGADVVVELPIYHAKGQRSVQIGGYHYLLRDALYRAGAHVIDVNVGTLKMFATGNGNANKHQMVSSAREQLGYQGHDDDEADALWLLEIGLHLSGEFVTGKVSKARMAVLDRIEVAA